MITRRTAVCAIVAGAFAPVAQSHSLYGQWVVYRRKFLVVGCHRKDPPTYDLAIELSEGINHAFPAAKARPARAPHPQRLASLLGTDQMEVAVLGIDTARQIMAGVDAFAAYGPIPLTALAGFGDYVLAAHADFPDRHAWMISAAIADFAPEAMEDPVALDWHPGSAAYRDGQDLDGLTGG